MKSFPFKKGRTIMAGIENGYRVLKKEKRKIHTMTMTYHDHMDQDYASERRQRGRDQRSQPS